MFMSHHQNEEQIHTIRIANISFENVAQLKYLGTTVTYHSYIHEETKNRLHSGYAC